MKCKIRMSYVVEMYVEGKDEEEIYDWMSSITPDEAKRLVSSCSDGYEDEIVCNVRDDSFVDYIIE